MSFPLCTIVGHCVLSDGRPVRGQKVYVYPLLNGALINTGSYFASIDYQRRSIELDSTGTYTALLPQGQSTEPVDLQWVVEEPGGKRWVGSIPHDAGPHEISTLGWKTEVPDLGDAVLVPGPSGASAVQWGPLALQPSAAVAGESNEYFATDVLGGQLQQVRGGTWLPLAPGVLHASTHGEAGSDPVSLDASQIATGAIPDARIGTGITASKISGALSNATIAGTAISSAVPWSSVAVPQAQPAILGAIYADAAQTGTSTALTPQGFLQDAFRPWLLSGGVVTAVSYADYKQGITVSGLTGWFPALTNANRSQMSAPTTIGLPNTATALQAGGDNIISWQGGTNFVVQFLTTSQVNAGTILTPPAGSLLLARVTVSSATINGTKPVTVITDIRQMRSFLGGRAYLDPVNDFGADPTGNVDVTPAFQACLNVATMGLGPSWICWRDGFFRIDGQLYTPSWNVGTYQQKTNGIKITGVPPTCNSIGNYLQGGTIWDMRWDGGFGVNATALGPFSGHTAVDSSAGITPITYVNSDAITGLGQLYQGLSLSTTGNNYLGDYAVVSGLWLGFNYDFFARVFSSLSLSRGPQDSNRVYMNNATPTDMKSIPDPGAISSGAVTNYLKSPQSVYQLKWYLDVDALGNVYATMSGNWTNTTVATGAPSSVVQAGPAPTNTTVYVTPGDGVKFLPWLGKYVTIGGVSGPISAINGDALSIIGFTTAPAVGASVTCGQAISSVQAAPAPTSSSITVAAGRGALFNSFAGYQVSVNGHAATITGINGDTLTLAGMSYTPQPGDVVSQYAFVPQTSSTLIAGPGVVGTTCGVSTAVVASNSSLAANYNPLPPNTIRTWGLWVDSNGNVVGIQDIRNRVRKLDCRAFGTMDIQGIGITRGRAQTYNANITYYPGQWVLAQGATWRAVQKTVGNNPTLDTTGTNWVHETSFVDMVPMLGFNNTYATIRDNVFAGPVKASSGWFPNMDAMEFGGGQSPLTRLCVTTGQWGGRIASMQESVTAGGQLMGTGSEIGHNYFDGIRRGVWMRAAANQCNINSNYFGSGCGDDQFGAAIMLEGCSQFVSPSQVGVYGTVLEATYYAQGHLWGYAARNNSLSMVSSTDAWQANLSGSRATAQTGTTLTIQPAQQRVDMMAWKGQPLLVGQNNGNSGLLAGANAEFVVMDPVAPVTGSTFQSQGLTDYNGHAITDTPSARILLTNWVNWTQIDLPVQLALSSVILLGDGIAAQEIVTTSGSAIPTSNVDGSFRHTVATAMRLVHNAGEVVGVHPISLTVKGAGPGGAMLYPHGGSDTVSFARAIVTCRHGFTTPTSWPDVGAPLATRDLSDATGSMVMTPNGTPGTMTTFDEVYYYTGTTTNNSFAPDQPYSTTVIGNQVVFLQAPTVPSIAITAKSPSVVPAAIARAPGQTADMLQMLDSDKTTILAAFGKAARLGYRQASPPQVFLGPSAVGSSGIPDPAPAPVTPVLIYGNATGFAMNLGDSVWVAMSWTNGTGETQPCPPILLTATQTDAHVNVQWPIMAAPTTGTPLTAKFYAGPTTNSATPVQGAAAWTGLGNTGISSTIIAGATPVANVTALGTGAAPSSQNTTAPGVAWSYPLPYATDMAGDVSVTTASTGTFVQSDFVYIYYITPFDNIPFTVDGWGASNSRSSGVYKKQASDQYHLIFTASSTVTAAASIRVSWINARAVQ